ncbi:hypothetical protein DIE07_28785 [Burkholderia sp. Bp9002]|nr:hypothetical protein DIE07_28785 [Burkholderia sp. Bp9002]
MRTFHAHARGAVRHDARTAGWRMEAETGAGSQPAYAAGGGGAAPTSGGATGGGGADGCAHTRGRASSGDRDFGRAGMKAGIAAEEYGGMRTKLKGSATRTCAATGASTSCIACIRSGIRARRSVTSDRV